MAHGGNTLIYCPSPAYTGSPGACICAPGYIGNVSYINGNVDGCFSMCTAPQFTGSPGACICSPGYATGFDYANIVLSSEIFNDRSENISYLHLYVNYQILTFPPKILFLVEVLLMEAMVIMKKLLKFLHALIVIRTFG